MEVSVSKHRRQLENRVLPWQDKSRHDKTVRSSHRRCALLVINLVDVEIDVY